MLMRLRSHDKCPVTQALKQQDFDQILQFLADVLRVFDELAIAIFASIILFPVMSKAVSFDVRQSALWTAKFVHGDGSWS